MHVPVSPAAIEATVGALEREGSVLDTEVVERAVQVFLAAEGIERHGGNGMPLKSGACTREWQWRGPWREVEEPSVRVDSEPSEASHNGIPDSYWREVPCGHPPDPIALRSSDGHAFCHCGWGLDVSRALPGIESREAPGPIVNCDKCGCYVAVPSAISEGERHG